MGVCMYDTVYVCMYTCMCVYMYVCRCACGWVLVYWHTGVQRQDRHKCLDVIGHVYVEYTIAVCAVWVDS